MIDGLLELWDVDAGWIYLADDDGLTLYARRRAHGAEAPPACPSRSRSARARSAAPRSSAARRSSRRPGADTGAMIVAPLLDGNRLVGVLGLAIRPSRATGRQELLLLQALGRQARRADRRRRPAHWVARVAAGAGGLPRLLGRGHSRSELSRRLRRR